MHPVKLIKQWHLSFFDENDIEYVKGIGCNYEINDTVRTQEVVAPNGQIYQYVVDRALPYGIYILTENDHQETMIMLKYAGDITLMQMRYQPPGEHYKF